MTHLKHKKLQDIFEFLPLQRLSALGSHVHSSKRSCNNINRWYYLDYVVLKTKVIFFSDQNLFSSDVRTLSVTQRGNTDFE